MPGFFMETNDNHISNAHPITLEPPLSTANQRNRVYHPNLPTAHPGGMNLLERMEHDQYASIRNTENLYYPFASKSEWELADRLSGGALSQNDINAYLRLERVSILAIRKCYRVDNFDRILSTLFLSRMLKISALASSHCLICLVGIIRRSQSKITQQNLQPYCTGRMASRLWSTYLATLYLENA